MFFCMKGEPMLTWVYAFATRTANANVTAVPGTRDWIEPNILANLQMNHKGNERSVRQLV